MSLYQSGRSGWYWLCGILGNPFRKSIWSIFLSGFIGLMAPAAGKREDKGLGWQLRIRS